MALTKEFAIIQGPPGTGKTFIGLKVGLKLLRLMLLSNAQKVGKIENCLLKAMCWSVTSCITLFMSCRLPMFCCITKVSGTSIEGVEGIFFLDF